MLAKWKAVVIGFTLLTGTQVLAAEKKVITTTDAPEAIGPYSQAIMVADTLYLSGQIPMNPKTNKVLTDNDSIEEQTKLVLENLKAVLAAAGMSMSNVVQTTVLMKDLNEFSRMNKVYATYFEKNLPARATYEVSRIPHNVKIEITAIARK